MTCERQRFIVPRRGRSFSCDGVRSANHHLGLTYTEDTLREFSNLLAMASEAYC
jgi:hypothetical protein